ncbi:MAG: hypothetical protein EBT92_10595 [Planctomycetes bacterium]|nr:hypothetical protein [Planctomycetota bacterium]
MKSNVIKVGGSLLDTLDLPQKLASLIEILAPSCTVIVVGGGKDVRELEKKNGVSSHPNEHWDSLRIMTENTVGLMHHFKDAKMVGVRFRKKMGLFFLDALKFCRSDKNINGEPFLPQSRDVRSDSVALRFAQHFEFSELYLLKSTSFPEFKNWQEACKQNYVDPFFCKLFEDKKQNPVIHSINLRCHQIIQSFNSGNKT